MRNRRGSAMTFAHTPILSAQAKSLTGRRSRHFRTARTHGKVREMPSRPRTLPARGAKWVDVAFGLFGRDENELRPQAATGNIGAARLS